VCRPESIRGRTLSLDGQIKHIPGALSISMACQPHHSLILPADPSHAGALVEDVALYRLHTLPEAIAFTKVLTVIEPTRNTRGDLFRTRPTEEDDYGDLNGQEHAKRPLEAAAASGHYILMEGPPGSRKTMLAKRLPPILPLMKSDEALETRRVPSVAGQVPADRALLTLRPFLAPHHGISDAGLIAG